MSEPYDINSNPFTEQRIHGDICATYEWRLVNTVDMAKRPLYSILDFVPHGELIEMLYKKGLDVNIGLSDRVVELLRWNGVVDEKGTSKSITEKTTLSLPFDFSLPTGEERLDVSIRAYVFRSAKDEFALQEYHQERRHAPTSQQLVTGSEILRCSLRCYGDRNFAETGALAQRLKRATKKLQPGIEKMYELLLEQKGKKP